MFLGTPFDLDEPIKREIDVLIDREFIYRDDSDEYVVSLFPLYLLEICWFMWIETLLYYCFHFIRYYWLLFLVEEMLISYSCFVSIL